MIDYNCMIWQVYDTDAIFSLPNNTYVRTPEYTRHVYYNFPLMKLTDITSSCYVVDAAVVIPAIVFALRFPLN